MVMFQQIILKCWQEMFACFHTAQRIVAYPELKINNFIIDSVTEFNFLGLIISSNMKWKKTYCSNITAGHKLHLLQKKAVRIVDHRHVLAHTEPICKRLRIVKI